MEKNNEQKFGDWRFATKVAAPDGREIGDCFLVAPSLISQPKLQSFIIIGFIFVLSLFFVGCQTSEPETAVAETDTVSMTDQIEANVAGTLTAMPTTAPTLPPPPVSTPVSNTSFSLVKPEDLPTETTVPTDTPIPVESPTPAPDEPTATPMPTFTPPALPQTSLEEHYWLRRPVAEGGVVWTDKEYPYGNTRGGQLRPHHGVEFNVNYDTEILAAASGTVVVAGPDDTVAYGPETNFYGNLVVIEHDTTYNGKSVYTLYGHLNTPLVAVGRHVEAQEVIGLSGATGVADGPHMHFEVRVGANDYYSTRNPLLWLWPFPDRGTVIGRITFPDGSLAYEAPVRVVRVDAPSHYAASTSYAQGRTNPDDQWYENFAIDDVEAGYYELIVYAGDEKYTENVWVYPRRTSFVEVVIGN